MASGLRAIGGLFGFGRPEVDQAAMRNANRERLNAQGDDLELQGRSEEARLRSARGGRRVALASQRNLARLSAASETLG